MTAAAGVQSIAAFASLSLLGPAGSGTATAPAFRVPIYATTSSIEFSMARTTRSWRRTPRVEKDVREPVRQPIELCIRDDPRAVDERGRLGPPARRVLE